MQHAHDIEYVPIRQLRRSPLNVRKSNTDAEIESLAASISSTGLLQNLIGTCETEDGKPVVLIHGGGRRMDALKLILSRGGAITVNGHDQGNEIQVPAEDYLVTVRIFPDTETAVEASLMENSQRVAMTVVDEFRAWGDIMRREGLTIAKLAARTGKPKLYVEQCMALASLEPTLLDRVADGRMELEAAKALTMEPDHARQLEAVHAIEATPNYQGATIQAWQIKRFLSDDKVACNTPLGAFIRDVYVSMGLPVTRDLFSTASSELLNDAKSARVLAAYEMLAARDRLTAEGWAWAKWSLARSDLQVWSYDVGKPDIDPSPEGDFTDWSPQARAGLGCFIFLDYDGKLKILKGYREKPVSSEAGAAAISGVPGTPVPQSKDDLGGITNALAVELGAQRTLALQAEMMDAPDHAMTLLLFTLWGKVQSPISRLKTPSNISGYCHRPDRKNGEMIPASAAADALRSRGEHFQKLLPRNPKNDEEVYDAIHDLSDTDRRSLMAYLVSQTIDASMTCRNRVAEHMGRRMRVNVRKHWTPDGRNMLGRVGKSWLDGNMPQALGGVVAKLDKSKKAERVEILEMCFSAPEVLPMDVSAPLSDAALQEVSNWLPPGMAFEEPGMIEPEHPLEAELQAAD